MLTETAHKRIEEASRAMVSRLMHMSIGEFRSLDAFPLFSGSGDETRHGFHIIFGVDLTTTPTGAFRSVKLNTKPQTDYIPQQHVDGLKDLGVVALANPHITDGYMSEETLALSLSLDLAKVVELELKRRQAQSSAGSSG
ncbi:hypothetical protein BMI91_19560 [Thioclava sediminum]|uniref:Uncharacterized protein n=1 Tax=Thioclava sediminum TaxID=1915319 RepID=A0ABX3MS04_9RHOB|nr:hypothetical protein [Thioclava sediminum]OOY22481.1 hypothetical protein BMI91_19560 [Thioclava sediminum]